MPDWNKCVKFFSRSYRDGTTYLQDLINDPKQTLRETGEGVLVDLNGSSNRPEQSRLPTEINDPIILVVYDAGHPSAPPGHVAMYYRGKVIDSIPKSRDIPSIIAGENMDATVGRDLTNGRGSSFFRFNTSSNAQIFVVDPKEFGIETEADRAALEQRMSEIIQEKWWDLPDKNCARQVLRALGEPFSASIIPLSHGSLKSFLTSRTRNYLFTDVPLLFGRHLSEMTDRGQSVRISHQALKDYEREFFRQHPSRTPQSQTAEDGTQTQAVDNEEFRRLIFWRRGNRR